MLNKHIVSAQRVLRKLEGTPIIVKPDNSVQVTYDYDTYSSLFEILVAVSKEYVAYPEPVNPVIQSVPVTEYHREKV